MSNMTGNIVYGNRNFMPFFMTSLPAGGSEVVKGYGSWDADFILDGQGVYVTRSQDYEGTFNMNNNIVFDNGINGLSDQKATNSKVTVNVNNNQVFDNGKTSRTIEKRQSAGGLTINSGGDSHTAKLTAKYNKVTVESPDVSYQCYGTCELTSES